MKKLLKQFSTRRGETLIEVLVALGIIAIVVTALASVVITSLPNARFGKYQSLASQYAEQGIEIVRGIRDNDYTAFRSLGSVSPGTVYCLASIPTTLNPTCPTTIPNVDNFLRTVTITKSAPVCGGSSNVSSVEVSVSWQDSKCQAASPFCHNSKLTTCLSTVNPVPTL